MAPPVDARAVLRAQQVIDKHRTTTGLVGDDEIILWHLLRDIIEWCDGHKVDFDATVSYVREDFAARQ